MSLHAEALHVGGLSTPIQSDRAFLKALANDGEGVWKYGDFKATPNASSHSVDISPGYATVLGDNAADQGAYFCWSESSETLAWPAPSAQPRIDTLILRVADSQYGLVTGTVGARWDIIQGVPAASPVARSDSEINTTFAVPGGWLRIADIRVNTADTGVIPSGQFTDQRNSPGLWTPRPFRMAAGQTTHSFGGGQGPVSAAVTLSGFTLTPMISLSMHLATGLSGSLAPVVYTTTEGPTGFTVWVWLNGAGYSGVITVSWTAVQLLPNSSTSTGI